MVVSLGLEAVGNVANDEGNRARLGAAGACTDVVMNMQRLRESKLSVQQGCHALAGQAIGPDNVSSLAHVCACDAVISAMKHH